MGSSATSSSGETSARKPSLPRLTPNSGRWHRPICWAARRIEPSPPSTRARSNSAHDRSSWALMSTSDTSACCATNGSSRCASRQMTWLSLEANSRTCRSGRPDRDAGRSSFARHAVDNRCPRRAGQADSQGAGPAIEIARTRLIGIPRPVSSPGGGPAAMASARPGPPSAGRPRRCPRRRAPGRPVARCRSPCSMKRSGMPSRWTWPGVKPASAAASQTALPKPPISAAFFDRDDERAGSPRARRIRRRPSGLTKRALITPTSRPSAATGAGRLDAVRPAACRRR